MLGSGSARSAWGWAKRHKLLALLLVVVVGFTPTVVIVLARVYAPHPDHAPSAAALPMVAERQTEPHTCGMHTLHALYRAHGLDPVAERVRFRLGTDIKAVFWAADSNGVLHPDLYMVLAQDGFAVDTVTPDGGEADDARWAAVLEHVRGGHAVVLLIKRVENGHLHWVAAEASRAGDAGGLTLIDSLTPDAPAEIGRWFFDDHVVTAVLTQPTHEPLRTRTAQRAGTDALLAARERITALGE